MFGRQPSPSYKVSKTMTTVAILCLCLSYCMQTSMVRSTAGSGHRLLYCRSSVHDCQDPSVALLARKAKTPVRKFTLSPTFCIPVQHPLLSGEVGKVGAKQPACGWTPEINLVHHQTQDTDTFAFGFLISAVVSLIELKDAWRTAAVAGKI